MCVCWEEEGGGIWRLLLNRGIVIVKKHLNCMDCCPLIPIQNTIELLTRKKIVLVNVPYPIVWWMHPTQCVPCSSFLAIRPCPVTSRVSHSLSGEQWAPKSWLMITAFCANFCSYNSASCLPALVISSLSTSIGRSWLGSKCCQRKE